MAFAQVDRLHIASSPAPSDLTGHHSSSEHVASGAFSPTQDADLLREAALRSRRARKQLSLATPSAAPSAIVQHDIEENAKSSPVEEDIRMEDATIDVEAEEGSASRPVNVDTEDGEIFEEDQGNTTTDGDIGLSTSGERASPLDSVNSDVSLERSRLDNHTATLESPLASSINMKNVRPSLNMTATDLDEAKRLILDLLGMGVTPEYLVDCGISAQCLAVCFYEMNLRFPLNLDRSQINLPNIYNLDMHMQESIKLAKSSRDRPYDRVFQNENGSSNALVVEMSAPKDALLSSVDRDTKVNTSRRGSLPSPPASLPSRPVILPSNLGELPYDELAPAQHPPSANVRLLPTGPRAERTDSAIVEEQKRMELLARKAAMDSIAKKRAARSSPNPHSEDLAQSRGIENEDVGLAVDALLAAVGVDSVSDSLEPEIGTESSVDEALPDYDSDAMVEDELDTRSTSISDADETTPDPGSVLDSKQHLSPTILSPASSPRLLPAIPTPHIRVESLDGGTSSGTFTPPPPVAVPIAARKARPTASDFIDQAPPRPSSAFTGDTTLKRKRCFVDPQVWPKRLVIDLDSSDEEEDDEDDGGARGGSVVPSTSNDQRSVEKSVTNGGGGRPATKQSQDMAAQMLLEKELQIKAMMMKIKMRELKKKTGSASASASASGTPVLAAANAVPISEEVSARPPPSAATTPPPASPDAIAAALEATRRETAAGVASTLKIQQEVGPLMKKAPSTEVSDDNTLGSNVEISRHKLDKGKGKAVEPEDAAQGPQDSVVGVSVAASTVDSTRPDQQADVIGQDPSLTHFKTYRSPLAAFTSPNLQPPAPTDRQLPTIYWISSTAGHDQNTNRKLCQYEFPSGVCKDQTCTDIHARDLSASDDDVRKTVAPMFPNAGPEGLTSIVRRVRQSAKPEL